MSAKAGSFRSSGFKEVERKQGKPFYCVTWCKDIFTSQDRKKSFYYFATCGGVNLSIFETEIGAGSKNYRLKHSYYDKDETEEYHSCAFGGRSSNENTDNTEKSCEGNYLLLEENKSKDVQPPLLCVGGKAAIIKVIDLVRNSPIALLRGHGNDITDLKVSPTNEYLLLSAAKDESCRLWNLETFACVCIFAGQNGHRKEEVLSVSWHPLGQEFASSGVDKYIRLWSIADPFVREALQASRRVPGSKISDKTSFRPYCSQFPYFATTKVHLNVVDCVQWLGDMILSKSTDNSIVLWMPDLSDESKVKSAAFTAPSDIIPLRTFKFDHCDKVHFIRFTTDLMGTYLAIGNLLGQVKLWYIDDCEEEPCQTLEPIVDSTVRMLSFAPDGKILIGCTDDGRICRWDYNL